MGAPEVPREPNIFVLEEQIKQLQRDVKEGFSRLEKQLEVMVAVHDDKLHDHEERIRSLETSLAKWVGIASAISAALGFLGSWIVRMTT